MGIFNTQGSLTSNALQYVSALLMVFLTGIVKLHRHCRHALQCLIIFQASIEYPRRWFGYVLLSFMIHVKTFRLLVTFRQVLNVLMGDAILDAVYAKCYQNINCIWAVVHRIYERLQLNFIKPTTYLHSFAPSKTKEVPLPPTIRLKWFNPLMVTQFPLTYLVKGGMVATSSPSRNLSHCLSDILLIVVFYW